jgi:hypothetical protein
LLLGSSTTQFARERGEVEIERGGEGGRAAVVGDAITPFFSADLEDGGKVRTAAISFQFVREDGPWMIRRAHLVWSEFCLSFFFVSCVIGFLIGKRKESQILSFAWSCGNWKAEQKTEPPCELTPADFDEPGLF